MQPTPASGPRRWDQWNAGGPSPRPIRLQQRGGYCASRLVAIKRRSGTFAPCCKLCFNLFEPFHSACGSINNLIYCVNIMRYLHLYWHFNVFRVQFILLGPLVPHTFYRTKYLKFEYLKLTFSSSTLHNLLQTTWGYRVSKKKKRSGKLIWIISKIILIITTTECMESCGVYFVK